MKPPWEHARFAAVVLAAAGTLGIRGSVPCAVADPITGTEVVEDGVLRFEFDFRTLQALGVRFIPHGTDDDPIDPSVPITDVSFSIQSSSTLSIETSGGVFQRVTGGQIDTCGALLLDRPGKRQVLGNLALTANADGTFVITTTLTADANPLIAFDVPSVMLDFAARSGALFLIGELVVSEEWSRTGGLEELTGVVLGHVVVEGWTRPTERAGVAAVVDTDVVERGRRSPSSECGEGTETECAAGAVAADGPDVIIGDLQSVWRYGRIGDLTAYAVATNACNLGTERANWIAHTNAHPVISQSVYRLKQDRFEQIGMSWVKHGFYAVSQSLCTPCNDPTDGSQLGVGCSDPYSAHLNGIQTNMSPRSTVNAFSGVFPYPWVGGAPEDILARRVQIRDADINTALNPGARYFIEGQYVLADDAAAGNHFNNASYREVTAVSISDNTFELFINPDYHTQRQRPAIRAWKVADPSVTETDIYVPGEGLFILAAKATAIGSGFWQYEYAIENLNSDRSGRSFRVPLPLGAAIASAEFHDVDYHSGDPYGEDDWTVAVDGESITWSTDTSADNPDANALRWGTLYNFRFQTNVAPDDTVATLNLFKPGTPGKVDADTVGPQMGLVDCNENGVVDACDIDCLVLGCETPCGGSDDCNGNGVPDDCEPDCNENGVADACDIAGGSSTDCNENATPDDCEPDCDGDGIPDDCDTHEDQDGDGVFDCFDACPYTTPPNGCVCPPTGRCCFAIGICLEDYPRSACIEQGGMPDCLHSPCRDGCLIGDADEDGDLDFKDSVLILNCFSGPFESAAFDAPSMECVRGCDFYFDDDIDLSDYRVFHRRFTGPVSERNAAHRK